MLYFKLVSLVCWLSVLHLSQATDCSVPPRFWCDNEDIAKLCGVLHACRSLLRQNSKPVEVAVYYESYCPDSIRFLTTMLYPTWKTLNASNILQPVLIPYGKATTSKNPDGTYSFECQHGAKECTGNLIENCLIKYASHDASVYLPIVQCIETSSDPDSAAKQCVTAGGLNWNVVNTCAQGNEGNQLMYQAGVRTGNLHPTLNWVHTDAIQQEATSDLLKLVCDTYQGASPTACAGK